MLQGFTAPYTPTGKSSLLPPPPWHYAGRVLSFGLNMDLRLAARFLPEGFGSATGRAFGHFCEWQSTTDGSELLDPAYSQYNEFFLLLEAESSEGLRLFCPFIYVTQDISLVRGLLQGWPKKMGAIWIGRSYDLDHPASGRIADGGKIGATLAVKDRRLAEAELEFTGLSAEPIGFLKTPTFGIVGEPTLVGGADSGRKRLVRQKVTQKVIGPVNGANGKLRLFSSPHDELGELTQESVFSVTECICALSVVGVLEAE